MIDTVNFESFDVDGRGFETSDKLRLALLKRYFGAILLGGFKLHIYLGVKSDAC